MVERREGQFSPFYRAMLEETVPTEYALMMWGLGLNVNFRTGEGGHVIGSVAAPQFIPILSDCLSKGASPNSLCDTGEYLIHYAIRYYNYQACRIIADHPDFEIPTKHDVGHTSWEFLFSRWVLGGIWNKDMIKEEKSEKYKKITQLRPHLFEPHCQEETLKFLLDLGLDLSDIEEPWPYFDEVQKEIVFRYGFPEKNLYENLEDRRAIIAKLREVVEEEDVIFRANFNEEQKEKYHHWWFRTMPWDLKPIALKIEDNSISLEEGHNILRERHKKFYGFT